VKGRPQTQGAGTPAGTPAGTAPAPPPAPRRHPAGTRRHPPGPRRHLGPHRAGSEPARSRSRAGVGIALGVDSFRQGVDWESTPPTQGVNWELIRSIYVGVDSGPARCRLGVDSVSNAVRRGAGSRPLSTTPVLN